MYCSHNLTDNIQGSINLFINKATLTVVYFYNIEMSININERMDISIFDYLVLIKLCHSTENLF